MKPSVGTFLSLAGAFVVFAAITPESPAQIPSPEPSAPTDGHKPALASTNPGVLARNLIGSRVQSDRGDELGTISDLLIDRQSGRLDYVVVANGGFFKIGRKLRPVPPNLLSTATAKRGVLEAAIGSESWKAAPSFSRPFLAELGDDAGRRIYAYYDQKWPVAAMRADGKPAGKSPRHSGGTNQLAFATSLIGRSLLDRDAWKVARITGILLDLRGLQCTFAIISVGGRADADPGGTVAREQFAVPVNELNESSGSERLTVRVTALQLQQAPPLTSAAWKTTSSPGAPAIYRYRSDEQPSEKSQSSLTRQ